MFFRRRQSAVSVALVLAWKGMHGISNGFVVPSRIGWTLSFSSRACAFTSSCRYVSTDANLDAASAVGDDDESDNNDDDDDDDDRRLLREVEKSQLVNLCIQYNLSTKGTKQTLLSRLRQYANEQAEVERRRQQERIARVEEGSHDGKERYEVINDYLEEDDDDDDDDDDEGYFYFPVPSNVTSTKNETVTEMTTPTPKTSVVEKPQYLSSSTITAPPPPLMEPNEHGERVVTVYSTKDHNDLTGIAASQPGYNNALSTRNDAMMAGSDGASTSAPWDMDNSKRQSEASSRELEDAKETVTELVHALLAMTGAPAFREEYSEGLMPMEGGRQPTIKVPPSNSKSAVGGPGQGFVGFDPTKVPTDILVASSQALRTGRGQVLQEVLRDYELRAVGHDGMAGDDRENGGGHYREVSKVRAFLEGYRRAEVRRVARETVTILLDKLVSEGIEGLDVLLASMTKTSDDTGDVGELNDALLDYLNDAIRQQEKKVEQLTGSRGEQPKATAGADLIGESDTVDGLWNVTIEDGSRVETLDPTDPRVKKALKQETANGEMIHGALGTERPKPETASEQLLLLLTLLRERIKAEAAFANDEKGRNLRILAYCLHVQTGKEREEIIRKDVGTSIDRLDSFIELVTSSVEYVESTSHQLQPARSRPLNISLLKSILDLAKDMRDRGTRQASTLSQQ